MSSPLRVSNYLPDTTFASLSGSSDPSPDVNANLPAPPPPTDVVTTTTVGEDEDEEDVDDESRDSTAAVPPILGKVPSFVCIRELESSPLVTTAEGEEEGGFQIPVIQITLSSGEVLVPDLEKDEEDDFVFGGNIHDDDENDDDVDDEVGTTYKFS